MSTSNLSPSLNLFNPQDSPTIPNLTFTYNGPTIPTGEIGLGNFMIDSCSNPRPQAFRREQPASGERFNRPKHHPDNCPTGTAGVPPAVPEPATLALAGIGLPLILAGRRANGKTGS